MVLNSGCWCEVYGTLINCWGVRKLLKTVVTGDGGQLLSPDIVISEVNPKLSVCLMLKEESLCLFNQAVVDCSLEYLTNSVF